MCDTYRERVCVCVCVCDSCPIYKGTASMMVGSLKILIPNALAHTRNSSSKIRKQVTQPSCVSQAVTCDIKGLTPLMMAAKFSGATSSIYDQHLLRCRKYAIMYRV